MSYDIDAIFDDGVFRPTAPISLPQGTRVHLNVTEGESTPQARGRVLSPRLADPMQAVDFQLEVLESSDGGL